MISRLQDLIDLAREPSSDKRRQLLREVTDQFFGAEAHTQVETDLYGAVLDQLSADMEEAVRLELSTRFSTSAATPRRLARAMALDTASVAAPMLQQSPVLRDADLIEIVGSRGQDHLRAVCRRESVSEAVTDAIVSHADDETLDQLVRNEGARLSRRGAEAVVNRAHANPTLHEAVVNRASLPPDLLNEMYFVVEARLRERILERNARLDPAQLEQALSAGRDRLASRDGALPSDFETATAYVRELRDAGALKPETLVRFLRSGGRTEFLIALSEMAGVDFHTARGIVDRCDLDALAVVCKAASLDRALFVTYCVVLMNRDGDAMGKAQSYAHMYAQLPVETAQRTLRFWKMRRNADAAIAA